MSEHAVVIAGGGPTGMMLAAELALAEVDVVIVERRPDQRLAGSRAGGLHPRTLEILDMRGIVDRFLAEGQKAQTAGFASVSLDISDFPTRFNHGLGLWQNHIERLLAERVRELRVTVRYDCAVTGFRQDEEGVDVDLSDGRRLRAAYLVGCDGGRSTVRKLAGIEFPGWDATTSSMIAEVEMTGTPELGIRRNAHGINGLGRVEYEIRDGKVVFKDTGPVRVMITEPQVGGPEEPTFEELRAAVVAIYGTDFGMHSPIWISRFTDMARQASAYRAGRVLLAGDAAHIHSPVGGQGLNTGVQDAVNLGWKLAQVVQGRSPARLLDTYHAERHPVAARVLQNTMAQVALMRADDRTDALRRTVADLLGMDEPRKRIAAMMTALDLHYDLGAGHPLLGRRMPDLDLMTAEGERRLYEMMHDARPLLVELDARVAADVTPWMDHVRRVRAEYRGRWELPVIGEVAAPAAVLVRPDGHVCWVGDSATTGLVEALTTWFGDPALLLDRHGRS